jgi:hypothetical protein
MGYTQNSNPFSRKRSPLNKTWEEAYNDMKRDTDLFASYGHMDLDQYTKEAKRQAGLYKQSGGTIEDGVATGGTWDVPTTEELKVTYPSTDTSEGFGDDDGGGIDERSGRQKRAGNKAKRIQGRIDDRPFGKEARPGQQARLAKAEAKAAGLSGKQARKIAKDTRRRAKSQDDIFV